MIDVRFLAKDGSVVDARRLVLVPRMGEAVVIDGSRFYVGGVTHSIEGDDHQIDVTILEIEEARRFLGGTQ